MAPPPVAVSTVKAEKQVWESTLKSVGSLEAVQGVVVSADVPGRVTEILFEPGSKVIQGEALVKQDISSELAQLRAAEANVDLAKANLNRVNGLFVKSAVSQAEMDRAEARFKEAVAMADNIKTAIAKKTIHAPFSGKLGVRQINLGQDLPSGAAIVSLQSIDSLFVNFNLPQQNLNHLEPGLRVRVSVDAVKKVFEGKISTIDPQVDKSTRSVKVQAVIDNKEQYLLPGMFASVEVILPESEELLVVPATTIAYATFGDSVFVVEKKQDSEGNNSLVAVQQFVQLGRTKGDFVSIRKGISANQEVVSAGVFKLRNGASIAVNNEIGPVYELTPSPLDK